MFDLIDPNQRQFMMWLRTDGQALRPGVLWEKRSLAVLLQKLLPIGKWVGSHARAHTLHVTLVPTLEIGGETMFDTPQGWQKPYAGLPCTMVTFHQSLPVQPITSLELFAGEALENSMTLTRKVTAEMLALPVTNVTGSWVPASVSPDHNISNAVPQANWRLHWVPNPQDFESCRQDLDPVLVCLGTNRWHVKADDPLLLP